MTAQLHDLFRYEGTEYSIVGISEEVLFDPSWLGLEPTGTCTACWRGYQAVLAIAESRLVLDTLHVQLLVAGPRSERVEGPPINGVSPTGKTGKGDWFNNHYTGLGYALDYSGGLLLADGFIRDLYVHMGFQAPWAYTTVIELIFRNGVLTREFDRSQNMAAQRRQMRSSNRDGEPFRMSTDKEALDFVRRALSLTYTVGDL